MKKWGDDNVAKASICVSDNGWIDSDLAYVKDFEPQTRAKANGELRALYLDGHGSHYSAKLLAFCKAHNIRVFELHQRGVNKEDFCGVFGRSFLTAFTEKTVKAAFSSTGIHPYNPNIIKPQQMKPSQATSTHGSFPQPQSSPVRASPRPIPIGPALLSPKRRRDPASDPDMFTPTKRMRFLGVGLANTSSGGFLVSKTKASALQISKVSAPVFERIPDEIEAPDWSILDQQNSLENLPRSALEEHCKNLQLQLCSSKQLNVAREAISVGQNAQVIVQNMTMNQLQKALHEKEKGKKSDRTLMFPGGKGRHLTADEVIAQKLALEEAKQKEEVEKAAKKTRKEVKKAEKAEIEERWKKIWQYMRRRLTHGKCSVPGFGRQKPRRPLKPKPKPADDVSDDDDNESGSDEEE
ncbi:hypothetical protein R3P38DRAFT_3179567 [Favolaschia claudopus]|uniref:DDE-1 domain-containing protein n=1 Tax=Favolaschia claudopus TaxID=2862362 RepID=A0AAW0CM69_9AGAR